MAEDGKVQCESKSRGQWATPYSLTCTPENLKDVDVNKSCCEASVKHDWEDAICSVCMEVPHNAVLLLCSSYNMGCRPYMCATSHRFSNCFQQYKRECTKLSSVQTLQPATNDSDSNMTADVPKESTEVLELLCPFCRKQVRGWTVVEPARKYLNGMKRTCMQDGCCFVGTYKQLRKHVKSEHPFARPREVDPIQEEKWKMLECESERNDVISTLLSSAPGAALLGDYVLEPNDRDFYSDDYDSEVDYLEDDLISVRPAGFRIGHLLTNFRYNLGYAHDPLNRDNFLLHCRAGRGYARIAGRASRAGFTAGCRMAQILPRSRGRTARRRIAQILLVGRSRGGRRSR